MNGVYEFGYSEGHRGSTVEVAGRYECSLTCGAGHGVVGFMKASDTCKIHVCHMFFNVYKVYVWIFHFRRCHTFKFAVAIVSIDVYVFMASKTFVNGYLSTNMKPLKDQSAYGAYII